MAILANNLSINGTITIESGEYDSIKICGSAISYNSLYVDNLDIKGDFTFNECNGKNIRIFGSFHSRGRIQSECFDAIVSSDCRCIKILANQVNIEMKRKFKFKHPIVFCDQILGKIITAENLVSKRVQGEMINIKGFSKIDELIYTDSYTSDDTCEIRKIIHNI